MYVEPEIAFLWHTLPLHYVPYLLQTGALLSATRIATGKHPLVPRPSAIRRKTKLGLADFVHLSLSARTPLLRDKQVKGYPHALIAFDRTATLSLPGVALLKYNTKRWAHRDDFVPVTGENEKAAILREYAEGRYPSLEVLVPRHLPLFPQAKQFYVDSDDTATLLQTTIATLRLSAPAITITSLLTSCDLTPIREYFGQCNKAGTVLPPPLLPFD